MKNVLVVIILILSFVLSAKVVQIEGEYTYAYSDDETIVQAKKKCLDFAKRDALEKFATYISSESVYQNYMTEKDEVVARSLGVLKNVVINEENIDRANSTIFYEVTAEIDEEEVLKKLEKKQEKNTLNIKIKDFVKSGINAEKQSRIGDALKYYYWALLLVKSEPKSQGLNCKELDDRLLTVSLPEKINSILTSINFKITQVSESKKYKNLDFEVNYKGNKVRNLILTYFNGDVWSRPVKVRYGIGNIELFGDAAESIIKLSLKIDYIYEEQLNYDHNVKEAFYKMGHIPFSSAKFKVKIPKAKKEIDKIKIQQAEEERIRKQKEATYLVANKKAEEEKLKKEIQDAALLARKQAEEENRLRKEKEATSKDDGMLGQHYNNTDSNIPNPVKKSFFGIRVGFNNAIFSGEDVNDAIESQQFINIGMFSNTRINKNIAFQIELNYSQKGAFKEDLDYDSGLWTEYNWYFDYLEIPIILKISIPINNVLPNVYAGFAYGILISATYESEDEWGDVYEEDMIDYIETTEATFIIGGGLDYVLNQKTILMFDMRYTAGITSWLEDIDIVNSVFSINIGIGF